jgi:hypothetical protein
VTCRMAAPPPPPTSGINRWAQPDALTNEWDIEHLKHAPRVGVACSGGGIRSASFCLGALQAVDASTDDGHGLRQVDYVSAVSGGGYTAGGWAITSSALAIGDPAVAEADPPVFAPGSPEEERLRRNSSLLQNVRLGAAGLGRLTAGLTINLLLVWAVMIAVAAPLGWMVSSWLVHEELQARTPLIDISEQPALVRDDQFLPEKDVPKIGELVAMVDGVGCSTGLCPAWTVEGLELDQADVDAWSLTGKRRSLTGANEPRVAFDPAHPAIVIVDDTEVRIAQQPRVIVVPGETLSSPGGPADPEVPSLSVDRQPRLEARGDPAQMPDALSLKIAEDPPACSAFGCQRSTRRGIRSVDGSIGQYDADRRDRDRPCPNRRAADHQKFHGPLAAGGTHLQRCCRDRRVVAVRAAVADRHAAGGHCLDSVLGPIPRWRPDHRLGPLEHDRVRVLPDTPGNGHSIAAQAG